MTQKNGIKLFKKLLFADFLGKVGPSLKKYQYKNEWIWNYNQ